MSDRVEQFIAEQAEAEAIRFREMVEAVCARCESPIERLLMAALYSASRIDPVEMHFCMAGEFPPCAPIGRGAFVYTQVPFEKYRADIAIWDVTLPQDKFAARIMIVECDGHDFHERTKEQARRDKQRDRYFQSHGFKVLRFTGSEIWSDPDACACEIITELACDDEWRKARK